MRSPQREGGFTLLELMAALVAGLVAISAIYAVGSGSARHFQEQQRIAQTQMALRMAVAQLRADIQRAGLYGTPDSTTANPPNLRGCPQPAPAIRAVRQVDNPDMQFFPLFNNATNSNGANRIEFDRVELVGNYATTGSYLITGAVNANQLRLQTTWQGFRRDFYANVGGANWDIDTSAGNAFRTAFFPGTAGARMLHIRTLQDTSFFTEITGTTIAGTPAQRDVRVNVQQPMPIASPCMPGLGDGASVAPLSRIEYAVVDPNDDPELAPLRTNAPAQDDALGLTPSVLVRRELVFGAAPNPRVVPGTTRVVLEYVADFDVSFVVDTTPDAASPTLAVVTGVQAQNLANPERIRSVIVRLSVRTPGTTSQFAPVPRGATDPLTRFQVGDAPRAARVRTIETEIFLPNLVPAPQ